MQSNNIITLSRPALYSAETSNVSRSSVPRLSLDAPWSDSDGSIAFVSLLQRLADPCIVFGTLAASAVFVESRFDEAYIALGLVAALLSILLFKHAAIDRSWNHSGVLALGANVFGSWAMLIGILMLMGAITGTLEGFLDPIVYAWLAVAPCVLLTQQLIARAWLTHHVRSAARTRRAIIVGINPLSLRLRAAFDSHSHLGLSFHGFFDDRNPPRVAGTEADPVLGQINEIPAYVKRNAIHVIYIALPMVKRARILGLLEHLRDTTASIYFVPDLFVFDLIQGRIADIDGVPVVAVCETPFRGIKAVIKRISDVVLASAIVTLIAPLMIAIAVAVKWTSPGSILFKQRRYGMDGREIIIYKFRTMSVCEDGEYIIQARAKDPRITPLGQFLRRLSLDELPQFINVLQGRMSIVGPRPHAVAHNELYRTLIEGYMVRHKVRPGITGWAQVNGMRGETESLEKMQRRIEFDLDYLRHWSLMLDLKIVARTVLVMFRDRNAY